MLLRGKGFTKREGEVVPCRALRLPLLWIWVRLWGPRCPGHKYTQLQSFRVPMAL